MVALARGALGTASADAKKEGAFLIKYDVEGPFETATGVLMVW